MNNRPAWSVGPLHCLPRLLTAFLWAASAASLALLPSCRAIWSAA